MKKIKFLSFFIILNYAQPTIADVIYFKNGDIISGTVTHITADKLTFKPKFSTKSEFTVPQSDIKSFKATESVTVEIDNNTIISGNVSIC